MNQQAQGKRLRLVRTSILYVVFSYALQSAVVFALQQPQSGSTSSQMQAKYQTVGEGKFSYWFWDLYNARLATADGQFVDYQKSVPLLLELRYLRDISKTEFVDATLDQWRIQAGGVQKQHKLWAGEQNTLWRDVKKGDVLGAEMHPDGLISFYFNQQLLGTTKDPAMGPAFFDIWLSEKTTAPELRQLLLALK
jgi:hypothetical protein